MDALLPAAVVPAADSKKRYMVFPPKLNFIYYIVPAATFQVSPAGFLNFFVSLYFFRQFHRILRAEIAEGPRVETVADAFGQRIVEVQVVHD